MPRVLVVAPNWIGDALMAQPLLARLRRKQPGVLIDVLAPRWVLPLMERMPEVSGVIESPFVHGALCLRGRWRLGRSLAARGYASAIVLPNTLKSALVPFFAGIPLRVGYVGETRYGLLNVVHKLARQSPSPMAARYLALAEPPGAPASTSDEPPRARLAVSEANFASTLAGLELERPTDARPVAVLCPGAEFGPAKRWPADYFAALAAGLVEAGFTVWLMGSAGDAAVGEAILAARPGCAVNLCGRTDLASAIDLLANAQLVVSNDSGLMHVAAALDRPLVALYGSSSPAHTPPASARARVQYLALECSPCYARTCPLGHLRCLRDLAPERVLGEALAAAGRGR